MSSVAVVTACVDLRLVQEAVCIWTALEISLLFAKALCIMQGLLRHVLDHNKHVQEAACSALATLEEQSLPEQLVPRLKVILETLAKACATYGRKNLRILYDAISTLAELVGEHLADPNLLRVYMPPLVAKWQSLGDADWDLLPLLECFTAITSAIGKRLQHFRRHSRRQVVLL